MAELSVAQVIEKYGSCHHHSETAELFIVINTTGKKQYVVASGFDCARWFSALSNHIRARSNGTVHKVREDWLAVDDPFRSALRRAVAAGNPGIITRIGNSATILENRSAGISGAVYSPLSSAI